LKPPIPFDHLDEANIAAVLDAARAGGARFAEVFIERVVRRQLRREEGRVRAIGGATDTGVGIRALSGDRSGYATTSTPTPEALIAAARGAGKIATGAGAEKPMRLGRQSDSATVQRFGSALIEPSEIPSRRGYLESIDNHARSLDSRVSDVSVGIVEESRSIFIANSSGRRAIDEQRLISLSVTVFVRSSGGKTFKGHFGGGGRLPFQNLIRDRLSPGRVATEAVRRALILTEAMEAPAGEMPVVMGNGWGGVLLHEAIGHGFEADFIRRGTSIFTGKMGQLVASPLCTVVDDGSIPDRRGSFGLDDEGTPPAPSLLIEKGRLTGYLHDLLSADRLGCSPTGNGRRQSFRSPPIPRQSNLFMLAGDDDFPDIFKGISRGFYAKGLGGGQVDIVNGNFVFEVTEGYLIEDGLITAPVQGANLIGSGAEVLKRIEKVGTDMELDPGLGTCGKDGQSQPVGVGQPTLKVSSLTVGGTRL
jgi:TldD protein